MLRRISRLTSAVVLTALLAPSLLSPASALALTLKAPVHVRGAANVSVSMAAQDSTGTVVLMVDGNAIRSIPAAPSTSMTFTAVPLRVGRRSVQAVLRSRTGVTSTPPKTVYSWAEPMPPVLISPSGGWSSARSPVVVKAGGSTTSLTLALNGKTLKKLTVTPNKVVSFGTISFPVTASTLTLTARNPVASKSYRFRIKRLRFPWATCIVIDKSDFKLYWVKNGVLVKTYPIAHGKAGSPTPSAVWRIDSKYYTDPGSVYGPRKMRLYRRVGSSYQYTRYLIHGTNQPWVIGTRASAGCIRMYNRDVLELFPQVPLGTMVQIRD